jgi:hypothetical protein
MLYYELIMSQGSLIATAPAIDPWENTVGSDSDPEGSAFRSYDGEQSEKDQR